MCHLVVEGCLHLGVERVLARTVVVWVVKVDEVPLLVEHKTMLEVVGGVLVKDIVAHIVVEGYLLYLWCHVLRLWSWNLLHALLL